MTSKYLLIIAAILVAVFLSTTMIGKCTRAKPVTTHTENREAIVKADSLLSIIDTQYRNRIDSLKSAYRDTLKDMEANYKVIVQKDVRIEYRYRKAPSVAACDSVIDSKNLRIGALETINQQYQYTDLMNDSLITSYQGSIRDKDQTIGQLNHGYEQATQDLKKAVKPKRWGLGVHVGYGAGQSIAPEPVVSIGLNYSLVRF
jgi:hypothetical protein